MPLERIAGIQDIICYQQRDGEPADHNTTRRMRFCEKVTECEQFYDNVSVLCPVDLFNIKYSVDNIVTLTDESANYQGCI